MNHNNLEHQCTSSVVARALCWEGLCVTAGNKISDSSPKELNGPRVQQPTSMSAHNTFFFLVSPAFAPALSSSSISGGWNRRIRRHQPIQPNSILSSSLPCSALLHCLSDISGHPWPAVARPQPVATTGLPPPNPNPDTMNLKPPT